MAHREVRADVDIRDRQEGRGQGRVRPAPPPTGVRPGDERIWFDWDADEFVAQTNGYELNADEIKAEDVIGEGFCDKRYAG